MNRMTFEQVEAQAMANRGWKFVSIDALEQALICAGWQAVTIEPLSNAYGLVICRRFSPLMGEPYEARKRESWYNMRIDAIQRRLVCAFQEQYSAALSERMDECWTVAPVRITIGDEASVLGRDAYESRRLGEDPRERDREYGDGEV